MKTKKLLSVLLALACLPLTFTACRQDSGNNSGDTTQTPTAQPYPRDFLCGYLITVYDPDDANYTPPTSNDFTSDKAITRYVDRGFYGNSSYLIVRGGLFINNSHNQCRISGDPLSGNKSGSVSMSEEFYYTSEIATKKARINYICYNEEARNLYTDEYSVTDFTPCKIGSSDEMQATVLNAEGRLETVTYTFDFEIEFKRIDKLLNIAVSEYDGEDNRLITVTDTSEVLIAVNNYQYKYETFPDCQYVTVSKTYEKPDGKTYTERTLYNKSATAQSEIIYVPYGNGLTFPMEINISFS